MEMTNLEAVTEAAKVESKLYIKLNEDPASVDFTFFIPKDCNYENAKRGALSTYEHIVRLENESARIAQEKASAEQVSVEEIIPDYDYTHADKLTQQYMGQKHYPFKRENEKRIILKIKPERIFVMPELKINDNWNIKPF